MSHKHLYVLTGALALMLTAFTAPPAIAQQAGATLDYVTPAGSARYNIGGTALAANGNAACALALASGRCMFTCGPGSLRCEGGTANLPFGKFQLDYLPCETDGNIYLQVFVQGNISFTGRIPCPDVTPRAYWRVYNNTCCIDRNTGVVYTSTYEVGVDRVTKRSISNSCTAPSTNEGFADTTPGTKNFSTQVTSRCGNRFTDGVVTMAPNTCYRFVLGVQGDPNRQAVDQIPCSSTVNTLQEDSDATPMAIFPMQPTGDDSGSPNFVPTLKANPQP